nr:PREDICTED: uncharacterized protein LOC100877464 isoform X1 [Megachile rotundata]XP_012150521.1 PREDICTED: uncharacterized protein LOC100877464 isoform X1 [Megachile rotundata]XP_012150527.1 PREDICTED: uncharacterized protein LOC100877464 isoform X1 [Megachile rotundata]XP_012150533.1 PREDICTED: uncharacterized protein LOC100877464 isoform X1 [Megachile rotundata]
MNYGGNMPDWHQYNASQTNEVTSSTQNVNSGHLAFIPGVNHSTLNALSLGSENLNKHQSDATFNPRNYQSYNNVSNGPNIPNNSPLASMVQMQNCIGHYGSTNTRNPMLDNINTSVDPRNATVGAINDEIGYRTNQVPFNGPIGHLSGPSCNLNASSGPIPGPGPGPGSGFGPQTNSGPGSNSGNNSGNGPGPNSMYGPGPRHGPIPGPGSGSGSGNLGPRSTNINSVSSGKSGPSSFMPCKGVCCNSNPNINYQQWEKFGPYQNAAPFRDNVHLSGCQMENRHFGNNCNFRKDNLEGKEVMGPVLPNAPAIDHRRNYSDYKYHKDHLAHRNYPASSGMFHNYNVQNYNYSTEHQKYTYPMKEHPKANNMNMSNSGMLKHQEQNFITQQKFNNKQFQYQNGNMLPKGVPTLNVNTNMASSPQNPYLNAQFPRNITTEMNHECQETTDSTAVVNRIPNTFMHSTPSQHQVYQHKIAMQKYAMENHLRELSNIPGYQSHPKYKECVLRYREILKLQQSTGYQNPVQQNPRVATPVNASVPPINLHFDQNGMLINSSYIADGFSKVQHAPAVEQPSESIEKQSKDQAIAIANEKRQQVQQAEQLIIPPQSERIPSSCVETFQKQNQFPIRKDFNQNQLKVQTSESHSFDTLNAVKNNETAMLQQKASKEFANKPELDVRQFLANWDETDDEDGATSNLQDTALSETTPVVVVSYENVDLSPKTPQDAEVSKRTSYCSNETDLDNAKEGETNAIATQDCLTISYSPSESTEIAKTSKRTIREGVVKPGSIIHCISNGPDEIPTIHIVDNLEISNILGTCSEQVIQTLEKQKTISFFKETSNNETEPMTLEDAEQQDKNETDVLSTNYDGSLNDVTKNDNMEDPDPVRTSTVSINSQELRTKNNLDVTNNMDLKKQSSFASEESHNPDDISLPDLPTSECTPISTTLNTPIHSDTEESSQNMEDLSISTNPIEVMQNSPVISFTQLNNEEKSKNRSLGTLELEFQKQNSYKTNDQEVTLGNFNFASDCKVKSAETKGKQVKSLGINTVKKKVFLIDGREIDTRISDTCAALTSIEYELGVEQEPVDHEKSSERASPGCVKHRSARKSTDSVDNIVQNVVSTGINANLSPAESDDETQIRRRKIKTSSVSTSTNSEVDIRKRAKEKMDLEDKGANKYSERSLSQRKDTTDHLRQSKGSDARRFDEASSSQSEEHPVCHMTSQYKHYSVAVIKDKVTLSDKRSGRGLDRTSGDKSPETRTSNNTKEFLDEMEIKKRVSGRTHESVQSSRKSELLQKDLKPVDGDVRYTAEEIRMLKEYRRRKVQDKSKHSFKTSEEPQKNDENSSRSRSSKLECPQIRQSSELHGACSEQNLSVVESTAKKLDTREEMGHACSKSFCKNTDFGIQVANVNLKIKDNDMGKELILGEKGPEQIKDSLEGIQIQINVSCTDQNSKGQEQKRLLYDDRGLYEVEESPALDCQCRIHAKEQETVDASRTADKVHRVTDKPVDAVEVTTVDTNANSFKKRRRASMGTNEDTCVLTSTRSDACCKEMLKADSVGIYPVDDKLKRAISNTAIVDANNKIKAKSKCEGDREDSKNLETVKVQKAPFTSFVDTSMEVFKRHEEKEAAHQPKNTKKLLDSGLEARSLSSLNSLDFNFDYKKYSNVNFERELDDDYPGKWKKPKIDQIFEDCDVFQSSSGYVNPIFSSIDKLEDLHTVPVYTTKDGKISYSPNRRFTYHELMMEARKRETCVSAKKSHYADTWNNYYNSKFRKLYKRKRHHPFSEKKKYEFKSTKYLYDRKRNYSDEFYGKSNTRYKDYVHSIKNNNAVWIDQYKMDSSSDSDEEIKRRIAESSSKKSHETKLVSSKSPKNHVTVDELDGDCRNKEDDMSDVCLSKDKNTCLEESQSVRVQSLDGGTGNESCQDNDNIVNDNLTLMQTDATLPTTNQGKEEANSNLNECSALEELCELTPEKLEVNESKNLGDECTELPVDESKDSTVPANEEETVNTADGSSALELLNEAPSSMNEDEQNASSNVGEDKNSEICLSETTQLDKQEEESDGSKVVDDQPSVDNTENIKQVDASEDLQSHQTESAEFEINVADCPTTESSESRVDSSNITAQISEEFLESEKYISTSDKMAEESSENVNNKVDEESPIISEENILDCAEENIQLTEEIVLLSKEQEPEECMSEEIEKNVESLVYENGGNSPKEAVNEMSEEQENSESQLVQMDAAIDQQNNLDFGMLETVENQKDIVIASVQMGQNEEEPNLLDFSKDTIYNENDNAIESLEASNAEEMEMALSSIEDTSVEEQEMMDHLHDHCSEMQSMSEHNSTRSSSVEKEMPVLNEYCTIDDSPVEHPDDIDRTEYDTEKQDPLSFDPYGNCSHSPESNTDVKAIPKLIIKKDALNTKPESLSNCTETDNCSDMYDAKLLPETRPKIPKMIIVKSRSRSATPTVELLEKAKSERTPQHSSEDNDVNVNVDNSDSEQYTLKYNYKNKVPKVKIKLEDISSKDLKLYLKRKALKSVPKMKIKKLKNQDVKHVSKYETQDTSESDATDSENESHQASMVSDAESEKIPKLRLKRQDEDKSAEQVREKDSKVIPKKSRKTKEEDAKHSVKQDNIAADDELRKKFPQYIIEKVPKVIIKRTQIGTEFKCEISKSKKASVAETSKWQPKVKLQRLELLDHIVKDLKQSKITLKNIFNTPTLVTDSSTSVADKNLNQNSKVKLSRSNSVSSLSLVKCKQRRLSDSGYLKDTKSISEFSSNSRSSNDRVAGSTLVNDETAKKKNRKRLSSQSKSVNTDLNNQNESDETSRSTERNFRNFLINEYNDLMITKGEYNSCFMTEESSPSVENKFLESDITRLHSYDNNDNSIIKVESSDDSQTTIEILPASPDSCDGETEKNCEFERINKLHMEDAIPTQLELELELIDNKMQHSGMFMLDNDHASHSKNEYPNEKSRETYFSEFQRSSDDTFSQNKYMFEQNGQSSRNTSNDYFYCTDLLVKEVLAAKEALKKCLTRPENKDLESWTSRPKTMAEKKQGSSFNFKGFEESCESECAGCNDGDDAKVHRKSKNLEKKEHKSPRRDAEEAEERYLKQNKHLSVGKEISKDSQNEMIYTVECPTASTCGRTNVPESTTISLKTSKKSDKDSTNEVSAIETDITELTDKLKDGKEFHGEKSKKEANSTQSQKEEGSNDSKTKEDNMPLLIPEFALNFDSSSDRDSSRSPPVITNQEEVNNATTGEKSIENKVIAPIEKIAEGKDSYKDCEMTIADIITQLAYHEKATIKHKRYCNLCERWFPTTSRHRRHLAGYQHRYMELTQRKSIHALFILFTGKPCPRLLPANVIRNDCSIGELTPLQIAVQDIAKCVEYTQQDFKTKE